MQNESEEYIKAVGFIKSFSLVIILFLFIYSACIYLYDISIFHWTTITNLVLIFLISGWAYYKASKRKKRYDNEEKK